MYTAYSMCIDSGSGGGSGSDDVGFKTRFPTSATRNYFDVLSPTPPGRGHIRVGFARPFFAFVVWLDAMLSNAVQNGVFKS